MPRYTFIGEQASARAIGGDNTFDTPLDAWIPKAPSGMALVPGKPKP